MLRYLQIIGFIGAVTSCAERELITTYSTHSIDDPSYSAVVFGDTLTLIAQSGCLAWTECIQYFYALNDSTLVVYSTGESYGVETKLGNTPINKTDSLTTNPAIDAIRETLSPWDFCHIDNDTIYRYSDSLLISISGIYENFPLRGHSKLKVNKLKSVE